MGPVENEVLDQEYENDDFSGTAETDFENDWDGSHKSTPNQILSMSYRVWSSFIDYPHIW